MPASALVAYQVGVDIGGTFTDAVVVTPDRRIVTGKTLTTPDDLAAGFFAAIDACAQSLGLGTRDLLARTAKIAHGATVGINALVVGRVADVAFLTTRGHGDAIRAMAGEGRTQGATLEEIIDFSISSKPDPVVAPSRVFEIDERVDRDGDVVVRLDEARVGALLDELLARGFRSIAVSFLWSFSNPAHELAVARLLAERGYDGFLSLSHEVAPRLGEYPRDVATIMNAQIGPDMIGYIDRVVSGARERGYGGEVLFAHCEGGLVPPAEAARFPILTLQSGPVAGVCGSAITGRAMGMPSVIVADMGGTTLDAAVVIDGLPTYEQSAQIVRQHVYLRKVDVTSIGAGGGSIAWLHEQSNTLRVGPMSAGAVPGPICYGRGGTEVTVTDADLVLGIINPDRPLAGGVRLDLDAAWKAMASLGERVGLGPLECAAGIVEIVDSHMEDLLRRISVQRGHDPRDLSLWAFGGASGAHAGLFSRGIGVRDVVFPLSNVASVWSAFGLTLLDHSRTFRRNTLHRTPFDAGAIRAELAALEEQACRYAEANGIAEYRVGRRATMKYALQVFDLEVELPADSTGRDWAGEVMARFAENYNERFGAGTGYAAAGAEITSLQVELAVPAATPQLPRPAPAAAAAAASGTRDVYWRERAGRVASPVFEGLLLRPGCALSGPAVLEFPDTVIAVRPGQAAHVDEFGNVVLTHKEDVA